MLIESNRWQGLVKHTITRVTPKRAHTDHYQLDREIKNGSVKIIGRYGGAEIATPELEARYKMQQMRRWVIKWMDEPELTDEQVKKMYKFIKEEMQ